MLALGLVFNSGCGNKESSADDVKAEVAKSAQKTPSTPTPAPAQATNQPTAIGSVSGKVYVTSAGDWIKFWDNGIAVEINGEFGVMYAGQSIYFGEDGHSPRTQCPYKQDGATITMTIKDDGTAAVFTVNKDGSLTGPPEGIWGHKAFMHMIPEKK